MEESIVLVDDNQGGWIQQLMVSDGDNKFSQRVYIHKTKSADVSCTSFSNVSLSSLVSSVNSYLAGSTKKLVFVQWWGLATTFYAIVHESTN